PAQASAGSVLPQEAPPKGAERKTSIRSVPRRRFSGEFLRTRLPGPSAPPRATPAARRCRAGRVSPRPRGSPATPASGWNWERPCPPGPAGGGAGPVGGDVGPVGAGDRAEPAAPVAGGVDEDRPAAVAGAAPQAVAAGAADGHGQPAGGGGLEPLGGVRHLADVVQV